VLEKSGLQKEPLPGALGITGNSDVIGVDVRLDGVGDIFDLDI